MVKTSWINSKPRKEAIFGLSTPKIVYKNYLLSKVMDLNSFILVSNSNLSLFFTEGENWWVHGTRQCS